MKREPKASKNEVIEAALSSEYSYLVIKTWKSDDDLCYGLRRQTPGQSDRMLWLLPTELPVVARCLSVIELQFSFLEYLEQTFRDDLRCLSHSLTATLGFNPEAFIPATLSKVKV